MENIVLKNILSKEELSRLMDAIQKEFNSREIVNQGSPHSDTDRDDTVTYLKDYGRIDIRRPDLPVDIIEKISNLVLNNIDPSFTNTVFDFVIYAEYSNRSGANPRLEPHYDVSKVATLILDYQVESNVDWDINVGYDSYTLEDNSGLLFDPLENVHYRPIQKFKDGEFVKMLFFRFSSSKEIYPKQKYTQHEIDELTLRYKHNSIQVLGYE